MAKYAIGVDGGGTRTRAVMVDNTGEVCGRALAGTGNYQRLGPEGVGGLLEDLLQQLGGEKPSSQLALCLALAGAGRADEQAEIVALARARWAETVCAASDARAALEGAHGGKAGIIAISGTGSIVLGKNLAGEEIRAGGWGPLLGDQGSGYHIGLEGLRAVFKARDGWGPDTSLRQSLRQILGIGRWDELVRKVYGGEVDREQIAGLGPGVFAAAADGDPVARRIVASAGTALGGQIGAVAKRLDMMEEVELVCVGGVFREVETLWPAIEAEGRKVAGRLRRRDPLLPPVMGAVLLAWRQAGLGPEERLLEELAKAAPGIP